MNRPRLLSIPIIASCLMGFQAAYQSLAGSMTIEFDGSNPSLRRGSGLEDQPSAVTTESYKLCNLETHREIQLPKWVLSNPELMANEFKIGSKELSDKYDNGHRFFYAYQPYLSKMVLEKLNLSVISPSTNSGCMPIVQNEVTKPKFKMMEIGLGCHPKGGMKRGLPGGSALGWRYLFQDLASVLDFELHIMEYDAKCANNWHSLNPNIATIHTGDASSEIDLSRVVMETGSSNDFDIIIDDASHINWHMIKTLETMIEQIQLGGAYIVEDIWSSCRSWKANFGTQLGEPTGGGADCMVTKDNKPTFYAKVVEWQKTLLLKRVPFVDVNHIDFHGQIVVFEKALPQRENVWKTKSS